MSWFSDLRESWALDRDENRRTASHANPVSTTMAGLDQKLRKEPAPVAASEDLHYRVMARVRNSTVDPVPEVIPTLPKVVHSWGRLATTALLIAAAALAVLVRHRGADTNRNPSETLAQEATRLPSEVISPLSHELESLQKDIESTTSFLLASVPALDD